MAFRLVATVVVARIGEECARDIAAKRRPRPQGNEEHEEQEENPYKRMFLTQKKQEMINSRIAIHPKRL